MVIVSRRRYGVSARSILSVWHWTKDEIGVCTRISVYKDTCRRQVTSLGSGVSDEFSIQLKITTLLSLHRSFNINALYLKPPRLQKGEVFSIIRKTASWLTKWGVFIKLWTDYVWWYEKKITSAFKVAHCSYVDAMYLSTINVNVISSMQV